MSRYIPCGLYLQIESLLAIRVKIIHAVLEDEISLVSDRRTWQDRGPINGGLFGYGFEDAHQINILESDTAVLYLNM